MGPRRKKSKQNTTKTRPEQQPESTPPHDSPPDTPKPPAFFDANVAHTNGQSVSGPSREPDVDKSSPKSDKTPIRGGTWGSWRAKASPVAQVARESISVAGGATSESSAAQASSSRPTRYMHNSLKRSSKSIPLAASETRVNVTCNNTDTSKLKSKESAAEQKDAEMKDVPEEAVLDEVIPDPPLPPEPSKDGPGDARVGNDDGTNRQSGWFGWWSRPDGYSGDAEKAKETTKLPEAVMSEARGTPLPTTPGAGLGHSVIEQENPIETAGQTRSQASAGDRASHGTAGKADGANLSTSTRSWFGLWSSKQNQQASANHEPNSQPPEPAVAVSTDPPAIEQAQNHDEGKPDNNTAKPIEEEIRRSKSTGWAFWSKDSTGDTSPTPSGTQKQVGELAVADTPSQSHPEAAQFNEQRQHEEQRGKGRQLPKVKEDVKGRPTSRVEAAQETPSDSPSASRPSTPELGKNETAKITTPKALRHQDRPNLVIPSFQDTYPPAHIPTYWERLSDYVTTSLRLADTKGPSQHVAVAPTPPVIRNAIAIGVHGYFPAPLIQKVLGQPTGTSIRFANYASAAIRNWVEEHHPETSCAIETVALEGEGFIADRVATLWKLLLNWLSHLRTADCILVACHSQGVPVAIMLVAKLIQLGCLAPGVRVGVCAMAGVNLGPFADFKSRFFGGSAAELFEFSNAESRVSKEYRSALEVVLRHGVRITYVGSIDDQLVSLEVRISFSHIHRNLPTDTPTSPPSSHLSPTPTSTAPSSSTAVSTPPPS